MIPFASQRGLGQDLATHLMNELDNEYMEIAQVRGAIARDLHGAFAEWEAQAATLTKCRNYLYSLSVNPDLSQGPLTREQYLDYIERAEARLGLTGQPRAVVFHIKEDGQGRMREHCHVVWSRIDAAKGKAVQMAFDHDKLMMVTREFARDHGLTLPKGYEQGNDAKNKQLSLYEKVQQDECGISKEERMALITQLWRQSDSARAFVQALEHHGYILATGKRPFVLVDIYGHTNTLPKLIDDKQVRTKDIRAFLGAEYAPETLPGVGQAQALAAQHRKAIDDFEKARVSENKLAVLEAAQAARREKLEAQVRLLRQRQHAQRQELAAEQKAARQALKADYILQAQRIRIERAQRRPRGLAAFLGRVSGVSLITKKVQRYRDRKRYEAFAREMETLKERQGEERLHLHRRQELRTATIERKLRGLAQVEQRERKSIETKARKEARMRINARHAHMPALTLELRPRGRKAVPHKAMKRHISPLAKELARAAKAPVQAKEIKLADEFARASGTQGEGESGRGEAGGRQPGMQAGKPQQERAADKLSRAFARAADDGKGKGDGDGGDGRSDGPKPSADAKPERKRRRKDKDHDQEQQRTRRRRRKRDLDRGM